MSNLHSSIDARVFDLAVTKPSNPSAGAALEWDIPANARLEILSVDFLYEADANAADRLLQVWTVTAGQGEQHAVAKGNQTANEDCTYHFSVGIAGEDDIGVHEIQSAALPTNMLVQAGDQIRIIAWNIQAGDQISAIVIRYKRWITE